MRRTWALLLAISPGWPLLPRPEPEEVRAFTIRSDKRSVTVSAENRWLSRPRGRRHRSGQYRQSLELDFLRLGLPPELPDLRPGFPAGGFGMGGRGLRGRRPPTA